MIKVDVISGFLGAGKTTLIKKLYQSKIKNEMTVIIENEYGKIGIDKTFLQDAGVEIKEINSGCICCSLVGDFKKSITELVQTYHPDRIIIEPSGVGKLSEIIRAVEGVSETLELNVVCTVVDGRKCKMYVKNFGEFFIDQVREAHTVLVSKTDLMNQKQVDEAVEQIREFNPDCTIITTPIDSLSGDKLVEVLEQGKDNLGEFIEKLKAEHAEEEHHHHHDDDDDDECCCHHHHEDEDEEEHERHHHHHHHHDDDDEDDECCCHPHHDEEDEGEHERHHHHHHDADEVFATWGVNTNKAFSRSVLNGILGSLTSDRYGVVLRAKGVVKAEDCNDWYYFDLVYGDFEIRTGAPDVIGKICVIGSNINEKEIAKLFG